MQTRNGFLLAALLALSPMSQASAAQPPSWKVVVEAGLRDRQQCLVQISNLPPDAQTLTGLSSSAGWLPFQSDARGNGWFFLPELRQGQRLTLEPTDSKPPVAAPSVAARKEQSLLRLTAGTNHLLSYQAEPGTPPRSYINPIFRRGGYLHPIVAPSGKVVTDDYPTNHTHHHGVWFPWTKAQFEGRATDFWNMGQGKGTVEFQELIASWSGAVHGGFAARHRFVDLTSGAPKLALKETWEVRVFRPMTADRPCHVYDLISVQECASASPLLLPKYHYGGLAFRGREEWNNPLKARWLNSENATNASQIDGRPARWVYLGGEIDGAQCGLAILCHPDNFRSPQPVRAHPKEPYFCFCPSISGDWEITPGKPLVSKYRLIAFDGAPTSDWLDQQWQDYTSPPAAKIVR